MFRRPERELIRLRVPDRLYYLAIGEHRERIPRIPSRKGRPFRRLRTDRLQR